MSLSKIFINNAQVASVDNEVITSSKELIESGAVKYAIDDATTISDNYYIIQQSDLRVGSWSDYGNEELQLTAILTNSVKLNVSSGDKLKITLGSTINKVAYKLWPSDGSSLIKSTWITETLDYTIPTNGILIILFTNISGNELQITDYDAITSIGNGKTDIEQGSWYADGTKEESNTVIRTSNKYQLKTNDGFKIQPGNITSKVFYRFFTNEGNVIQPDTWQTSEVNYTA